MTPILRTLAYHQLFQDPLTIEQIHEFLITPDSISLVSVHRSVEQLLRKHQIVRYGPLYALPHFSPENIRQHADRMKASREKMTIARRAAKIISFIPWVKSIAVTGALAMENADADDDIDLMVVTSSNRLWLTRPLVLLLVSLFFKRRKPIPSSFFPHPSSFSNTLCLNLWLDESALAIPTDQHNLYTAHELAQMTPLVNKDQTYERMMRENGWGRKFLANAWEEMTNGQMDKWTSRQVDQQTSRQLEKLIYLSTYPIIYLSNYLLTLINVIAFKLQHWYMKSKMTTERVSLRAAYFHPGNRSREILHRYQLLLEKMKIEKPKKNAEKH